MTEALPGARLVAWMGFLFGSMTSILFNVLGTYIPPEDAAEGWKPSVWSQVGAAFWPCALLLSVEVLARSKWPEGLFAKVVRFGGVAGVALFAGTISYQHIRDVLISWNYPGLSASVGPLVIDGLMIVSGYAMVASSVRTKTREKPEEQASAEPERLPAPTPIRPPIQGPERPPAPAPRPRVSALVKTRAKQTGGKSNEEIIGILLAEENPDLTKRGLMSRFSIGAARVKEIADAVKSEQQRKEES